MSCILCLKKKSNQIKICSKKGQELKCSSIIAKHFWLQVCTGFDQPSTQKNSNESVCLVCWNAVSDFHKFYQFVAEAHNYLESEDVNLNTPRQEFLNDRYQKPKKELAELSNDLLFDAEVKLEINDLDNLPGIEVIENVYGSKDCSEKAINTNPQQIDNTDLKETSNTSIKQEFVCHSEDDSESEIPLSMFLQSDLKIDDKPLELSIKTKEIPKHNSSIDNKCLSHENFDSESDGIDNSELTEQFAEVPPKRTSAKPKTNGKRAKQTSLKRAVEGEFGSRILKQENCDEIIAKLENSELSEQLTEVLPKPTTAKTKTNGKRTKPTSLKRTAKRKLSSRGLQQRLQQEKYDEIIAKLFDKFPCRICKLFVRNFGDMRSHFNVAHKGSHPSVECCERSFQKRLTLADHVLVHLNPEHFKCSKCGQILKDSITLKEHEESHDLPPDQLNGKKTFNCHICSRKLSSKHGVEKHVLRKHVPKSEYKIPCEECNKMFPTEHILKKHVRETHRGSRTVICDQCGKTMHTKYILKKHIEHEHMNIPKPEPVRVQCTICQMWLRDIYSLRNHMQCAHTESEGEHRCDICGALSVNARSLKRHITYIHKLERRFQCSMCEKAFRRAHELKEHTSTHTGEVLFSCAACPMMFTSKANLYKHRRCEHGHQPKPVRRVGSNKKPKGRKPAIKKERNDESEELNMQNLSALEEAGAENILTSKEHNLQFFQSAEPNMQNLSI